MWRAFHFPEELLVAFEARARELACSVEWLIAEAMKQTLERAPAPKLALRCGEARAIVDRAPVVIGRSPKAADLVLRHRGVSRQHAIVERVGGSFAIVDMASTNGVLVNGKRSVRAILVPGDVVGIGPFTITVDRA